MKLSVYGEYLEWNCPYAKNTRNAQKFEYLSEFEVKIENTLGDQSWAQVGSVLLAKPA